ncbi:hypothetical protein [Sphingomonas kyeonggiensis]|uniref:Uncharacterized protein n=1 Tax=Sphingomonas kyeonggiensis TaxID=1268553 RepID=A0A7W6JQ13_9SPHN|nr:hypothetical protein [Sphingomonas kyeonggiensis]MBB4097454.1 hypothetical protein [Sphingomonas kyeonggiensis]
MYLPTLDDLPFNKRPDLSPYLIHLTKNTKRDDEYSAYDNLVSILQTRRVDASDTKKGFIKGPNGAACFMDVPFASLKYVLTPENTNPDDPRYEPFGIIVTKEHGYKKGLRPVLHLSNDETRTLGIPRDELWRVVRLERSQDGWINWVHEREWRCKGSFRLPKTIHAVIVKDTRSARRLRERIYDEREKFACVRDAILPASVICQGLLK